MVVWDHAVRGLHAALAVGVLALLGSGFWSAAPRAVATAHEGLGWAVGAVLVARGLWGFIGPRHARWRSFLRGPRVVWAYARNVTAGTEVRYLGHNPLGGWMVLALLVCTAVAVGSGALLTTDAFWGDEAVWRVHRFSSWALLGLVPLHVGGVVFTSRRQREALVAAMWWHGRKPAARPGDID